MKRILLGLLFCLASIPAFSSTQETFPAYAAGLPGGGLPLTDLATQSPGTGLLNGGTSSAAPTAVAIIPTIAGLACDGITDDAGTINAALSTSGVTHWQIPPLGCRAASTITIPVGVTLSGITFGPSNGSNGSRIICDIAVTPCVSATGMNGQSPLENIVVTRASGTPASNTVGVFLQGYQVQLRNVSSINHGVCYQLKGATSTTNAIAAIFITDYASKCLDAYIDLNSWAEFRLIGGRYGANGGGDYSANAFVRVEGGFNGTAGGPNTVYLQNAQFNQGNNGVAHFLEFVNLGVVNTTTTAPTSSGTTITVSSVANLAANQYVTDLTTTAAIPAGTKISSIAGNVLTLSATVTGVLNGDSIKASGAIAGIDATDFRVDLSHVEGLVGSSTYPTPCVVYTDSTWNILNRLYLTNNSFNSSGVAMFCLNSATQPSAINVSNNYSAGPLSLSGQTSQPIGALTVNGNIFQGSAGITLVGTSGSTASVFNNAVGNGISLSGAWGSLQVMGDTYVGGSLSNTATGTVNVIEPNGNANINVPFNVTLPVSGSPETTSTEQGFVNGSYVQNEILNNGAGASGCARTQWVTNGAGIATYLTTCSNGNAFITNAAGISNFALSTTLTGSTIDLEPFGVDTLHLTQTGTTLTGTVAMPSLASSSTATTGTVCWTTSTGNLNVDATTTCLLSDGRHKMNVEPLDAGLSEVMMLRPVSYDLKPEVNPTHLGRQVGLIAQDVIKVDPRLASTYQSGPDEGTPSGVRYEQMVALLVKGMQEQQHEIDDLKDQVKQLTH